MAFLSGVHFLTSSHCKLRPNTEGTIRFVGYHQAIALLQQDPDRTERLGVELDEPVGLNNGVVQEHQYFSCAPKFGVLCYPLKVSRYGCSVLEECFAAPPPAPPPAI
jgi:dynactin complex subunit